MILAVSTPDGVSIDVIFVRNKQQIAGMCVHYQHFKSYECYDFKCKLFTFDLI